MKYRFTLFLLFLSHCAFSQNICLEKLAKDSFPNYMGFCNFYTGTPADFNNDGYMDVPWWGDYVAGSITFQTYYVAGVLNGSANGAFNGPYWSINAPHYAVMNGDFNEDGFMDMAAVGAVTPLSILLNDGTGNFMVTTVPLTGSFWAGCTAGDFDGDHHLDIIMSHAFTSSNNLLFLHGNGNGTFASPVYFTDAGWSMTMLKGDFNNDGLQDAAIAGGLMISNGGGSFSFIPSSRPQGLFDVGDFNTDGNLDLIGTDSIYLGSGFSSFPTKIAYAVPPGTHASRRTADLNHDGLRDLVVERGDEVFDTLLVLTGNGNGTFSVSNVSIPLDSLSFIGPAADYDGNGTEDIFIDAHYVDFETCVTFIYPLLNHTAHITGAAVFCSGDSALLQVNAGNSTVWSTGATTDSIYVSTAGTYYVNADYNGCQSADTFSVGMVNAATFFPVNAGLPVCLNSSPFQLTSGAPAGGTYSGPGVSNNVFDPLAAGTGTHTLVYTYAGPGACNGSDSVQVTVDLCMGVAGGPLRDDAMIYPNPGPGVFSLSLNEDAYSVFVHDALGRMVHRGVNEKRIDLSGESAGVYFIKIISGAKCYSGKLMVEK